MIYINGLVVLTAPAAVFQKEKPETLHRMSAFGQKRTCAVQLGCPLCPIADITTPFAPRFCRARGGLRIAAITAYQHQGHGAFG